MPFIELKTGKTVFLSDEEYWSLTDQELEDKLQKLVEDDAGDYIDNPFCRTPKVKWEDISEELTEEEIKKLIDESGKESR